ncbi:ELKS/Rab6-interacting/CAST family member 1-like protein [Lates japonicus]|uniref:ELKS/Rab6-interacting/CAST family member 1-like protein n=1 Tax=Lates japonicus TaxID=270547 RepID=A0AAD3MPI2_LATJO|nr:ELKS/Rab6-interacting/CAST family member 1-like protein [Lates japonicus]
MDSDSPFSRVERTLWTVWYYITGAVNRFLRPEPTDTVSNDPNSFQESTVDSEPPDAGHPESDTSREVVNEEQAVATASLLSSSKPVVAWELCTTEINLGPGEESMQYKSSESKASEEGEGTREEQISQTGNDDAGLLITNDARAKEDEKEENRDRKLFTHKQDETAEIDEYEDHAKTESLHLTDDAMSEDMDGGGGRADAQEEAQVAVRLDDLQKIEENVGKIQVMEEDDEMHHEDEEDLEVEDTEITLSPMTDFSFEEERNVHIEEACVQRDETDTSVTYEEVENSEDVLELGEKQVKNQFSVCEEPLENVEDVKQDTGLLLLNDDLQMTFEKSGHVSEDVEQEHLKVHRSESDKIEDEREEEEESTLDEREQGAEENVNVSADSQSTDEEPEQEEDIKTVPEDSQEDILTERVSCHEEVMQNAEAESTQHTAEFTDEEKEDVAKDAKVQTKIRETDNVGMVTDEKSHVTTTDISVDERFFDKDQVEEERLSSEEKDSDDYMEIACTTTSVTGVPEGETGQEISGEFENITPGICEGPVVVSQELNSPTCKETQEGVPEYNNEPGPDENITQRFLEVGEGDCKEIHDAQLPEEVESEEPESLQNTGGDYLLVSEHMEEERQSTEDITDEHTEILNLTDTGLPQETEKTVVEPVTEGSGRLFEEEEGKSLDSSMKMGIEHSEKEFETYIGVTDKTNEATKELRDETGELLVEFEIDEGLSDFRDAARDGHEIGAIAAEDLLVKFTDKTIKTFEAEEQKMTEMTFQESDILIEEAVEIEQSDLTEEESIIETGFHPDSGVVSSEAGHLSQESDLLQEKTDEERVESAESETGSQKELDADITDVAGITDWKDTEEANEVTAPDCPSEIKHESRSGTETSLQEEIMSAGSEDDTCAEPENLLKLPSLDKPQPGWVEDIAESLLELDGGEVGEQLTTTSEDQIESDRSSLDFTAQRSRIAVKNPRVRPPKDPRSLLHMPSVEPTPSSHMPVRVPAGVPLGGMGIGIKLPGLGAGFPVLKKTRPVVKGETSSETPSQEPETKPEKKSDTPKEDEVQHKPKWMPPRQPGFGNPLMSELKSKLKKPTQE